MRMTRFILALTIAAGIWTSEAAAKTNGDNLLPDDYVFAGVDGKLVQTGVDKWTFGDAGENGGGHKRTKRRNVSDMGESNEIRGEELFIRGILFVTSQT